MKTVLITGCCGLLGTNFAKYLRKQGGYVVVGIDDLSGGYKENIDDGCVQFFYQIDLCDADKVERVFKEHKPDYVYHFAAYAAEGLSPFIRRYNYQNNSIAYTSVINNCVKYSTKKLIVASSMAVYGQGNPPFAEDQKPAPEDPYGIAKYAMEMDVEAAGRLFDLRWTVVRPHNIVGKYQNIWDRYRNVIGIWIRRSLAGETITIYGDGTQVRAFSDVKFYMRPFEQLMEVGDGEIINIGADKYYSINEAANMVKEIAQEYGYYPELEYLEKRDEVHTAYCDHTKAKTLLHFDDKTDLKCTIRQMFAWALHQPQKPIRKMNYEIEKNLYSFWKNE